MSRITNKKWSHQLEPQCWDDLGGNRKTNQLDLFIVLSNYGDPNKIFTYTNMVSSSLSINIYNSPSSNKFNQEEGLRLYYLL